jgi:hypothetical protein
MGIRVIHRRLAFSIDSSVEHLSSAYEVLLTSISCGSTGTALIPIFDPGIGRAITSNNEGFWRFRRIEIGLCRKLCLITQYVFEGGVCPYRCASDRFIFVLYCPLDGLDGLQVRIPGQAQRGSGTFQRCLRFQ